MGGPTEGWVGGWGQGSFGEAYPPWRTSWAGASAMARRGAHNCCGLPTAHAVAGPPTLSRRPPRPSRTPCPPPTRSTRHVLRRPRFLHLCPLAHPGPSHARALPVRRAVALQVRRGGGFREGAQRAWGLSICQWAFVRLAPAQPPPDAAPTLPSPRSRALGEAQIEDVMRAGVTDFVCLQAELPPQEALPVGGKDGFLPYRPTATLVAASLSGPPSLEVMEGLRNPHLDQFLPTRRAKDRHADDASRAGAAAERQRVEAAFGHWPVPDLGAPTPEAARQAVEDISARLRAGRVVYLHCWGGRGRAGTLGALTLAELYGIGAAEALARTDAAIKTREPGGWGGWESGGYRGRGWAPPRRAGLGGPPAQGQWPTCGSSTSRTADLRSPETDVQRQFVQDMIGKP